MRKLIAIEFLSVDGVMQGLGSPDEDREGGFEHGGWGAPYAAGIHSSTSSGGLDGTTAISSAGRPTRRCPPTGRMCPTTTRWPRT